MELIRCDNCKTEVQPAMRHITARIEGLVRTMQDSREDMHFCSEECVALYFRRATVTYPSDPEAFTRPIQR